MAEATVIDQSLRGWIDLVRDVLEEDVDRGLATSILRAIGDSNTTQDIGIALVQHSSYQELVERADRIEAAHREKCKGMPDFPLLYRAIIAAQASQIAAMAEQLSAQTEQPAGRRERGRGEEAQARRDGDVVSFCVEQHDVTGAVIAVHLLKFEEARDGQVLSPNNRTLCGLYSAITPGRKLRAVGDKLLEELIGDAPTPPLCEKCNRFGGPN
jgi:hypothetical protein